MIPYELFLQYGISGIALYLMYSITYNHLVHISDDISDIRNLLEEIRDKL